MALPVHSPSSVPDPAGDLAMLEAAIKKPSEDLVVKKLARHIEKVWQQVQKDNKQPRLDMVNILRRVRGEYDPNKLTAIRAFKGSEAYIRTGENKARAAESWIKDIYRADVEPVFELEPTAVPDLPDETLEEIKLQVQEQALMIEARLAESGVVDRQEVARLMNEFHEEAINNAKDELVKSAKERCKRAADLIRDQNQEGGWNDAFKEFLYYFIRLKAGIIKGPILTKKPKTFWRPGEDGNYSLQTEDVLVHDVYCVSPFNFYPAKGMKKVGDGDIIEIHELSKQAIASLIGVPGYDAEELRAVIAKYEKGELKAKWFIIEDETVVKQVTKEKNATSPTTPPTQNTTDTATENILAMEFSGTVSGKLLLEWSEGSDKPLTGVDPQRQYQANCWKIGDHVVKAVINPDSLGRKPYHISSWAKNPEWIWGEGLLEFAAPLEDALNAIMRALINNIAIASGPMCEIDRDRVDMRQPIYPWRQIESTSMQMKSEGPAVNYYQPQMHAQELITAWQFVAKVLDEMTVPAYVQGASQSGVTTGTATVFTQLLSAATRSVKAMVANIDDDIITPYNQMCYDNLMQLSSDDTIKGDARAVARGIYGLQAKEQQSQRKVELLTTVANPAYMQILGAKNVGALLAQVIKGQDIKLPDLDRLEGDETVEAQVSAMLSAQSGIDPNQMTGQIGAGSNSPAQPQGVNPDGSQAGVVNG